METITISPESPDTSETLWRASSDGKQSVGRTAGEALDNLTGALDNGVSGSLVIVQPMQPDRFFTAEQRDRLRELMARRRAAREADALLPLEEQMELEALVVAEQEGAARRVEAMLDGLKP